MNRYESYKAVNLPWLKEVPIHWELKRLSRVFLLRKEKNTNLKTQEILSLSSKYGVSLYSEKKEKGGNKPKEDLSSYFLCYPSDILMNSMNIVAGSVGISNYFGAVSPVYYPLVNINDTLYSTKYMEFIFRNYNFQRSLVGLGKGIQMSETDDGRLYTVRMRISWDILKVQNLGIPPLKEQIQIANYLDWKINEIDKLIAKEKEKITELELLFKNKLGEIFKKLNVKERSIKNYLLTPISDGPHETPEFIDEGIPFVSVESVENGKINIEKKRGYISEELYKIYCKKLKPQLNDIFLVKSGSTTGKVALVDFETEFSVWSPLALIRVNRNVDYRFMFYMLASEYFQEQIRLNWSFGTQPNIGMKVISNLKIKIPLKIEQEKIVDLAKKLELNINNLINKTNQQIKNLESLKQSLIAEVVTGQIDVRDVVIPEYEKFNLEITQDLEEEVEEDE